jgi:predicted alpha/beta-fold hydrolase
MDVVTAANFSFHLTNPARGQAANANITLDVRRTNYETPNGVRMFPDFRLSLPTGVEDTFYPLAVDNAKIVVVKIGQRSPFLCDENRITLAITSNVSLQHCTTIITVSGLTGMAKSQKLSEWQSRTVLRGVREALCPTRDLWCSLATPFIFR